MQTIELNEEEFLKLKRKNLIDIFTKNKSISLLLGKNRIDIYEKTMGYKQVIKISVLKELPRNIYEPKEDPNWTIKKEYLFSLSNIDIAINAFIRIYKNIKSNNRDDH